MTKARVQALFIIAFALSLLLHAVVGIGMLFKHLGPKPVAQQKPTKIVEAVAVNQHEVEREVANIRQQQINEARARQEEIERYQQALHNVIQQRDKEQAQIANLSKTKQRLNAKLKADQLRMQHEARKQAELERNRQHLAKLAKQEKARLAILAKKQHEAELKAKREAEALKKAEAQRKLAERKVKEAEEAHLKAQKLAKRLHDEQLAKLKAQQQAVQNKAMLDELQAEQQKISATISAQQALEIAKYKARIISSIAQNWRVPHKTDKSLSCELLIHVGPGGTVLDVSTLRSSGHSLMDRSAQTAVYKASPLPVPSDPKLFNSFRELRLTVRPEQVISS